jgi:hypothetical protein
MVAAKLPRAASAKGLLLVAFVISLVATASPGGTTDKYGGLLAIRCRNATGWFHTEKLGNRWWLCTPDGHGFFFQAVGGWQTPILPKYNNDGCTAAAALIKEFTSWNFNGVGELSDSYPQPIGTCPNNPKLPEIQTINVSNYAAANLWNYAQRPMKNLLWGLNANYRGWRASTMDFFEPQLGTWLDGYFHNDAGFRSFTTNPYFLGVMLDDTDWFFGMGAGPDFHTIPEGHTNAHVGYMVLITSPVQTFNLNPASRGIAELYSDPKVYSKTAMANPPASCSVQMPCSLRDYLYKKYNGNISALDAAWGSNYTTFDSTGTQVTGEAIGTGDGSTKSFTATLAHHPISPESVLIKLNRAAQAGDCPSFQGCNVVSGGSLMGTDSNKIVTGIQPWARDSQITEQDCAECGFSVASYWLRLAWHMKPGFVSMPSREVGWTFSSGNPRVIIKADNGTPLPANATGVDIYLSCRVLSGPASHGCAGADAPQPKETLQAANVPFPNGSWEEPISGLVDGPQLPTPPNTIDYSTGQITLTFSSPIPKGQTLTADYIYNGWMYGTGLMDEDGRHTVWLGSNAVCLSPAAACDGRDNPRATANPRVAADLDEWVTQFSAQYFSTLNRHLKAAAPHVLYFGADTVGTWGVPPRKEILEGAAPYVDGLFTTWFGDQPTEEIAISQYLYLTRFWGDKPLMNFVTLHAQRDSAMARYDNARCCFGLETQVQRGQQWRTIVSKMLNTPSSNNSYQWVGIVWWSSHDFNGNNGEYTDWGLKTTSDNAYDGHEAGSTIVPCSPPLQGLQCGGETRNYGDAITAVKDANQLWTQFARSTHR